MVDATVVPSSVLASSSAQKPDVVLGATLTQGVVAYKDPADSEYKAAIANSTDTLAGATDCGILITAGDNAQPGRIVKVDSDFDPGFTAVQGIPYVLSAANAGKIAPFSDLTVGQRITFLGWGKANGNLDLNVKVTGLVVQ